MSELPEVLKKPLVFGSDEQIRALRDLAEREDYKLLPKCQPCDGTGERVSECPDCEGVGKDFEALAAHHKKYP